MKNATPIPGLVGELKRPLLNLALAIILLITLISGCSSVISNSESFYKDIPRRPINWREYLTD
jgi:hypothetical protein